MPTRFLLALISASGLILGASSAIQAAGDHEGGHQHEEGQSPHTHGFAFGNPVKDKEPDRTVKILAKDTMEFNPSEIDVKRGEIIRFVVKNTGSLHHSFTIGTREWHKDHEKSMQGVAAEDLASHMKEEPNGTVVPPGETRSLTWKFVETGTVPIGCHVPGHYPAGMKGDIEIEAG